MEHDRMFSMYTVCIHIYLRGTITGTILNIVLLELLQNMWAISCFRLGLYILGLAHARQFK